jgi:hypothetical protein
VLIALLTTAPIETSSLARSSIWDGSRAQWVLRSLDTAAPFPGVFIPGGNPLLPKTSPFTGAIATHTRPTDNIVRVGLSYRDGRG